MMKYSRMSVIAGLLLAFTPPLHAEPETEGVIREVKRGTQQIRIDERLYRLPGSSRIRNFTSGTDHLWSLEAGQPVRYSLVAGRTINELWVLPTDTRELKRLKLMRDYKD
jgi:hypothetical protein